MHIAICICVAKLRKKSVNKVVLRTSLTDFVISLTIKLAHFKQFALFNAYLARFAVISHNVDTLLQRSAQRHLTTTEIVNTDLRRTIVFPYPTDA